MKKNNPSVALLVPSLNQGGAERVSVRLTEAWKNAGISTRLILFDGRIQSYEASVPVIDLSLPAMDGWMAKGVNWIRRAWALSKEFKRQPVSQVVAFMDSAAIPATIAKRLGWITAHLTISIRDDVECLPKSAGMIARRLYPMADRIVFPAEDLRNRVIAQWGLPAERCVSIYNPLDKKCLNPAPGLNDREPIILACGRLDQQKGFDTLIRSFAMSGLSASHRLVILGKGALFADLFQLARDLGVANRLDLHGSVDNVLDWMRRSALFVLSSRHEGFPNVLAEAMACGCPCVATDCPTGPREMLINMQSGILVPVDDTQALAAAMNIMMGNRTQACSFAREARKTAESWAVEQIAPRWIINSTIDNRQGNFCNSPEGEHVKS